MSPLGCSANVVIAVKEEMRQKCDVVGELRWRATTTVRDVTDGLTGLSVIPRTRHFTNRAGHHVSAAADYQQHVVVLFHGIVFVV